MLRFVKIDLVCHALTPGLNQCQSLELTSQQHLLQVPVARVQSDVTHIPDHNVLHTDIILPETREKGIERC